MRGREYRPDIPQPSRFETLDALENSCVLGDDMPHAARESLVAQRDVCGREIRYLDVAKRRDAKPLGCQLAIAPTAGVSAGGKGVTRLRVYDKEHAVGR